MHVSVRFYQRKHNHIITFYYIQNDMKISKTKTKELIIDLASN